VDQQDAIIMIKSKPFGKKVLSLCIKAKTTNSGRKNAPVN
jgi:hypothetical protein